jgi:hypothetical protein
MKNIPFFTCLIILSGTTCLTAQITLQYTSSTPVSSRIWVPGAGERYAHIYNVNNAYNIDWKDGTFKYLGGTTIENMPTSLNPFGNRFTADWLDQDEGIEFVLTWRPANTAPNYAIFDDDGKRISPVFRGIPLYFSDGTEKKVQVADTILRLPDLDVDHVFPERLTPVFRTQAGENNAFRYAYVSNNATMTLVLPNYQVERIFSVDPQLFNCLSNIQVWGTHILNQDAALEWYAESQCINSYNFQVFSDNKELCKITYPSTSGYAFSTLLYPKDYAGFTSPKIILRKGDDTLLLHDLQSGVLEQKIAAAGWVGRQTITEGYKYMPLFVDTLETAIKIFHPDGKLWKAIPKTESLDFFAADFSSTTYDNDPSNTEVFGYYVLPNNMKKFRVIREDGTILFSLDNFTHGSVSRQLGLENKLIFNRLGQGLSIESRVYRLPSIFLNENEPVPQTPLQFTVSPNPFRNQLQIHFDEAPEAVKSIRVFNFLGQLVFSSSGQQMGQDTFWEIPEQLPSGAYFIQINTETKSGTLKLVKE